MIQCYFAPHLAFVNSRISGIDMLDLQDPVVGSLLLDQLEPRVRRERAHTVCEDQPVPPADPRQLKTGKKNLRHLMPYNIYGTAKSSKTFRKFREKMLNFKYFNAFFLTFLSPKL